jgi:hypothetical protein
MARIASSCLSSPPVRFDSLLAEKQLSYFVNKLDASTHPDYKYFGVPCTLELMNAVATSLALLSHSWPVLVVIC